MAAIDGLLALMDMQKASGLVLETGRVPALLVGDATRPLSMPPLEPATFRALVDEILDPAQRDRLREQATVDLVYRSGRSDRSFNVTVRSSGDEIHMRVTTGVRASSGSMLAPSPGADV